MAIKEIITYECTVCGSKFRNFYLHCPDCEVAEIRLSKDGNPYAGPAVGSSELDELPGHWHTVSDTIFKMGN